METTPARDGKTTVTSPQENSARSEPSFRLMPVDAEGRATGATAYHYGDGLSELWAYYAKCLCCQDRKPFFSPSDRDIWVEAHRVRTAHAIELTVEPWDFTEPPWVAADGLALPGLRRRAVQ